MRRLLCRRQCFSCLAEQLIHLYIPETELLANINWVDANLKNLGYNMIEVDGWGDSAVLNENGYRVSHSQLWEHDYAWWSAYLQSRGCDWGCTRTRSGFMSTHRTRTRKSPVRTSMVTVFSRTPPPPFLPGGHRWPQLR
jgi:hypothetical protein